MVNGVKCATKSDQCRKTLKSTKNTKNTETCSKVGVTVTTTQSKLT